MRPPREPSGLLALGKCWVDDRGPAPADAAAWERAWADAGFGPGWLRVRYPRHVVPWRCYRSRQRCGGPPFDAWPAIGLAPEAAVRWFAEGHQPCCARVYDIYGRGPAEAAAWADAGFPDPMEFQDWSDAGVPPDEADRWVRAGAGPYSAVSLRAAGLSPELMLEWSWLWGGRRKPAHGPSSLRVPTQEDVMAVLGWAGSGLVRADVEAWMRAGFTASEASQWPVGTPRPDSAALDALAALRNGSLS